MLVCVENLNEFKDLGRKLDLVQMNFEWIYSRDRESVWYSGSGRLQKLGDCEF